MTDPYPYEPTDSPDDPSRFAAFRNGGRDGEWQGMDVRALEAAQRAPQALAAAVDRALAALPPMGLDEAVRQAAERKAQHTQAEELARAAQHRLTTDPLTHMRAELAARVVDAVRLAELDYSLDEREVNRQTAKAAAAVALELVERDRDTAEAKVNRLRALALRALESTPGAGPVTVTVPELLDTLADQGPAGVQNWTPDTGGGVVSR